MYIQMFLYVFIYIYISGILHVCIVYIQVRSLRRHAHVYTIYLHQHTSMKAYEHRHQTIQCILSKCEIAMSKPLNNIHKHVHRNYVCYATRIETS